MNPSDAFLQAAQLQNPLLAFFQAAIVCEPGTEEAVNHMLRCEGKLL